MNETLRAPALFVAFGLLAALALQPRLAAAAAFFGLFLLLGALIVWGTAAPPVPPSAPFPLAPLAGAVLLAGSAWLFQRPLFPTAGLLALVLFIGRHPALPLPQRPAWGLLADLASGFLLGILASGRPGELAPTIGAGHLALAYAGLLLYAERARPLLGHAAWLAFYLLGAVMVAMKFYPVMTFIVFFLGSGSAIYFGLTGQEPDRVSRRTYGGLLLLLGLLILLDRLIRP